MGMGRRSCALPILLLLAGCSKGDRPAPASRPAAWTTPVSVWSFFANSGRLLNYLPCATVVGAGGRTA